MKVHIFRTIVFASLMFNCISGNGQIKQQGVPFIKNYLKKNYNAGNQSWNIIQHESGLMYFANNYGVLQFDGNYWETYPSPNNTVVRSIAFDKQGNLYAGYYGDFAVLKPDSLGHLKYHSLTSKLPASFKNFAEIWKVYDTKYGMVFQAFTHIFILKNDEFKIIMPKTEFHFSFYINNRLLLWDRGNGLCELVDDKLVFFPESKELADKRVEIILPLNSTTFVLGTLNNGLYLLTGDKITKWQNESDNFLKKNQIFTGCALSGGFLAFGTIQNGVLITDNNGFPIQHINTEKGLQNNTILSMASDRWGNLWLGLDKGIDYVEISSPFSHYNKGVGLLGTGYAAALFNNKLYLGTNQGLFYKTWTQHESPLGNNNSFQMIPKTEGQVWNLEVRDEKLLCSHNYGGFEIDDRKAIPISQNNGVWTFMQLKKHPDYLIQGTYTGMNLIKRNGSSLSFVKTIENFNESCRKLEEDDDGNIWMSHGYKGVYKINLADDLGKVISFKLYDDNGYFKNKSNITVTKVNNELVFTSPTGAYSYKKDNDKFIEYEPFKALESKFRSADNIYNGLGNNLWVFNRSELVQYIKTADAQQYKPDRITFLRLKGMFVPRFDFIITIDSSNILFGTDEGFVHFDPAFKKNYTVPFTVNISRIDKIDIDNIPSEVSTNYNTDNQLDRKQKFKIPYSFNHLKFYYAAIFFEDNDETEYQYFLKGFDKYWSEWTFEKVKEYTNLPEGKYAFHVRAKNCFDFISEETVFAFEILPPWYKSIWARIVYFIMLGLSLWGAFLFNKQLLKRQKRRLDVERNHRLWQQQKQFEEEALKSEKEILKLKQERLEDDLAAIEQRKIFEDKEIELKKDQTKAEQEINKLQQEKLQAENEFKSKELASLALHNSHKNEILQKIKEELLNVIKDLKNQALATSVKNIISSIDMDLNLDDDWKQFELHFDEANENFVKRLKEKYPTLKPTYIKLCVYIRMNLTSKQIASLMNTSLVSVEKSRYRLREKLNIEEGVKLSDFIKNF